MSDRKMNQVRDFLTQLGYRVPDPNLQMVDRVSFMVEECLELLQASAHEDEAGTLDALVDLQYFLLGTIWLAGYADIFDAAFDRVHAANLQKFPGTKASRRPLGIDAVRGDDWTPADFSDLIEKVKK